MLKSAFQQEKRRQHMMTRVCQEALRNQRPSPYSFSKPRPYTYAKYPGPTNEAKRALSPEPPPLPVRQPPEPPRPPQNEDPATYTG